MTASSPTVGPIRATDYHTAGEPFRIVQERSAVPSGSMVAARRASAMTNENGVDDLRRLLCSEPRGHADMYGGFVTPPDDPGAHFGALFWHKDGFSTACGHGTLALGIWATDTGRVDSDPDGVTEVRIDVPSGRVAALVERSGGRLVRATFRNVPSYPLAREIEIATSRGSVCADLSYSGAIYASVRASDLGLRIDPAHYNELIAMGREVKRSLQDLDIRHGARGVRPPEIYGTILFEELDDGAEGPRQRNVTVFADGQVDRSPCGSGTGARIALLAADGRIAQGQTLEHRSIVDTVFFASWSPAPDTTPQGALHVVPHVTGTAHRTGEHCFVLDDADGLGTGFLLR